jgi:hypothetical protein
MTQVTCSIHHLPSDAFNAASRAHLILEIMHESDGHDSPRGSISIVDLGTEPLTRDSERAPKVKNARRRLHLRRDRSKRDLRYGGGRKPPQSGWAGKDEAETY